MTGRIAMIAVQTGLVALAAWVSLSGPLRTPFFDAAARAERPDGDWRAGDLRTLFDPKAYRLAMAREWLATPDQPRRAAAEVAAAQARAALAYGPADGYGWLTLAWAEFEAGHADAARAALSASWREAPRANGLALSRALLARLWWRDLDGREKALLIGDAARARRFDPRAFDKAAEAAPMLRLLQRRSPADAGPTPEG